jgi:hypothetical protein
MQPFNVDCEDAISSEYVTSINDFPLVVLKFLMMQLKGLCMVMLAETSSLCRICCPIVTSSSLRRVDSSLVLANSFVEIYREEFFCALLS